MSGIVSTIEENDGLDRGAKFYADLSGAWTKPTAVKNLLSGTWLGHQLHPMLSDMPIGAWGAATFLDLLGGEESADAARKLVAAGLLAAVPTAASGANDYADTYGAEQRVGFVHAVANVVGVGLQAASLLARTRGNRTLGIALSGVGLGFTAGAGYLGGHLSYVRGVGVNNNAFAHPTDAWTDVAADDDLVEGTPLKVDAAGVSVMLVRQGAKIHALSSVCSHASGPLEEGKIEDGCVVCPWHGSRFHLEDGSVERGPATVAQPAWDVRVDGGRVSVKAR